MSASLQPGDLLIRVRLERARVAALDIVSDRPVSLVSRFPGRPLDEVAATMARVNAVCGRSHGLAVRLAGLVASGHQPDRAFLAAALVGLAAERIREHLKSLMLASGNGLDLAHPDLAALRTGFAVAHALEQAAGTADRSGLALLVAPLPAAVAAAGRLVGAHASRADALHPEVRASASLEGRRAPDALTVADDAAVIAGLLADPQFARAPALAHRRPETGPPARQGISAADVEGAARARLGEIEGAVGLLDAMLAGPNMPAMEPWFTFAPLGSGEGFAAIETPRGRLYTWLHLKDGLVTAARAVAPTEWNFHPSGPFAAALAGAVLGRDPAAEIARRASAFDPCVGVRVEIAGDADA
ncbi:MAG: nickel-dependent hydrogenase large subunit [Ancalomicrobiaceae bacterium]|nr:nickel-dependent hydrogenase large subunit [Ancalomicrobiaceae bacterium]